MSSADPAAKALLERARRTRDDLAARLLLAAAVTRAGASVGLRPVVVGGTTADFYVAGAAGTSAAYPAKWRASADVDVVVIAAGGGRGSVPTLQRALKNVLGLEPDVLGKDADGRDVWGRSVEVPDFDYALEIVSDELNRDPLAERLFAVEVEGEPVWLRGPEDTLLAYGESGWELWDGRDWERALAIYRAMRPEIDEGYLDEAARARGLTGILGEIRKGRGLPDKRRALF